MFDNRLDAGLALSLKVKETLARDPSAGGGQSVVIGLPRGGVPVAYQVARRLGCPLDVLVSKKVPAPGNEELAIGAVTSSGTVVVDERLARYTGADRSYLEREVNRLTTETADLERHWIEAARLSPRPDLRDKIVIVVDDGIATGMTAMAALRCLQTRSVARLILAVPVISTDAVESLRNECDVLIALAVPGCFGSVGQYYMDFRQVEDSEVASLLEQYGAQRSDAEPQGLTR